MRVDLRLQGPELGLGHQVLHLYIAKLLDMFDDGGFQPDQHSEVFAQVAAPPLTGAKQDIPCVAASEAQGHDCLDP